MEIIKSALAGTLESSDAAVRVEPRAPGLEPALEIRVESSDTRYASKVRATVMEVLASLGVLRASVSIQDRNALDCTVRARVLAACLRGADEEAAKRAQPWGGL